MEISTAKHDLPLATNNSRNYVKQKHLSLFVMPTAILAEASYFSHVLKILACFKIIILMFSHLNMLHRTQIHQR